MNSNPNSAEKGRPKAFAQTYFHGTKADLKVGDTIEAGNTSNYGNNNKAKFIYLSATLDAAIWGAELALGKGKERIYLVEPTGALEDDPNVTDKKFPGNPTLSYRSREPFLVVGEVIHWQGHPIELLEKMREGLEKLKQQGVEPIED
ncbi:MAG: NAD(+)--rifampin ADP-ribosyltransferase [Saprospiraceae bacterium]|nr:NAD(+)--rifampin ADP-ribosyltransferase [Saprospiraceae bacterium]